MIISFRKKFVFLHTPKTGGTSIANRLLPYARLRDRLAYQQGHPLYRIGASLLKFDGEDRIERLTGLKAHASLEEGERVFGRETLEPLFKFAIVRNPFTRTYSLYRYIVSEPMHPLHREMKGKSLNWFVDFICKYRWPLQSDRFHWRGETGLATDFIGGFESFDVACERLSERLGVASLAAPQRLNAGAGEAIDYAREFSARRNKLVERYRRDFEIFGYSQDPAEALAPPASAHIDC